MVNFGTNLMKSAHNIAIETDLRRSKDLTLFTSTNVWGFGMTIFIVGSIVNFASFAFAAQSLLAALGTVQFISNVFFAKFVLNETLTTRIFIATAIIMGGLIMAILCSNHDTEVYTTQDLLDLYTPGYIFFVIMIVIFLVLCHAIYIVYTKRETDGSPLPLSDIVRPACYSIVSATIGTQSVLQSKCLAELIKATINGDNQFDKPFVYIIIVIFAVGLCFWLYRMNAALKKFDGLVIIPLLQVFWTTSAIFQGGVYFQEFIKFTPLQTAGFLCGVGIVFVGVYLLNPSHDRTSSDPSALGSSDHSSVSGNDIDTSTSHLTLHSDHLHGRPLPQHSSHHFSLSGSSVRGLHGVYGDPSNSQTPHLIGFTCLPVLVDPVPCASTHHMPPPPPPGTPAYSGADSSNFKSQTKTSGYSSVSGHTPAANPILEAAAPASMQRAPFPSPQEDVEMAGLQTPPPPAPPSSAPLVETGGETVQSPLVRYKNQIIM